MTKILSTFFGQFRGFLKVDRKPPLGTIISIFEG
jgi:hypothetical protein